MLFVVAAILIALGIFILYFLDRKVEDQKMYWALFGGTGLLLAGIYLLFYAIPTEIIKRKVIGLILSVVGFWLTFKFPGATEYQGEQGYTGIILGIITLVVGIYLLLF